jgi:hypothetical protein
MLYHGPYDQPTNPNAPYVDGNPAAGIQGSIVPAASIEYDQREIVDVINEAYLRGCADNNDTPCAAPTDTDLTQLRKAIEGLILYWVINRHMDFTVGGPGADFPDLIAAMVYLSKYRITNNGSVTLWLAGSNVGIATPFVYDRPLIINHPNLDRISIIGAPLKGSPVQGSDFVYSGNLTNDQAAQLTMLRQRFGTELYFTGNNGIIIEGLLGIGVGGGLSNVLITSDGTGTAPGLTINNSYFTIFNSSIHGFAQNGIISNNSLLWSGGSFLSVSGCGSDGFEFQGGLGLGATQTIACSNGGNGFLAQAGAAIRQGAGGIYAKGNVQSGLIAASGAGVSVKNSSFLNNAAWGLYCIQAMVAALNSTFSGNTSGPLYANIGGGIYITGSTGFAGCSPALNTQGNGFAFIWG